MTSYSSPGASVLVSAPGGGGTDQTSQIVTTDRVGVAGYSPSTTADPNVTPIDTVGNYTGITGTSFSAPIVSGVVALMLQANPHLGYRDVQEILAYTARETSASLNLWKYNGAGNWNGGGLHYDAGGSTDATDGHNLGYGLVDVRAAVRLAETWSSISHTAANREQVTTSHTVSQVIPDNMGSAAVAVGAYDSISVSRSIDVERAEVTLNVTHPFVGDLSVWLTSPSGTSSCLLWRPQQNRLAAFGTDQHDIHFTFDTVLSWGENSLGNWQLRVYDNAAISVGTFDSWTLNLIGKPASADDVYIYTDEFAQACLDQPSRSTLTDTGGIDTINAAACSSNLLLNLTAGSVSSINGRSFTISTGTIIENAFGGDGDDNISGNDVSNVLSGGRGNDILDGGGGIDTALYIGVRADYVITSISNGFRVISSKEGTDILTNVEFAQFSDKTIALTVPDTTPPTVSTFSPTDEDINVAIANNIVVTFNEAIIRGTGDILLKNAAGTIIETYNAATSINLSISGSTLTINPTTNLSYSTGYRVEFASSTIKDLAGNSYTGTTDYNFTTIPFVNTAPTGSVTITGNATQNQTLTV